MKPFDELTEAELVALTDAQVARYFDFVCAEEGIGFLPDPPVKPAPLVFETDTVIYNVGSLHFSDPEDARKVAQAINDARSRIETGYVYLPGPGYRSCSKVERTLPEQVTVSPTKALSPHTYDLQKAAIEAARVAGEQYEADEKRYEDIHKRRERATEHMQEVLGEARQRGRRRAELHHEFDRFVELADGDRTVAWRFLERANSDAERLVPELAPVVKSPPQQLILPESEGPTPLHDTDPNI